MKVTSVVIVLLIILAMATTLLGLEKAGRAARFTGRTYALTDPSLPITVAAGPEKVFALWKQQGVRGALLVHLGRDLHFSPVDKPDFETGASSYPVVVPAAALEYESALEAKNFLWLAMRTNIARQVVSVLPHDSFLDKISLVKEAVQNGYLGVLTMDATTIVAHELGSQRVITDGYLPSLSEPVVLNIDASMFESYSPTVLYTMLEKAGLRIMFLSCCLSEGNEMVSAKARTSMTEFVQLVASHGK